MRGGSSLYETVLYPEAHFPYRRRQPDEVKPKYNVDECAKFGASDLRMMDWRHGVGWVYDDETPRSLTLIAAEEAWQGHLQAVRAGIQSRSDKVRTRKNGKRTGPPSTPWRRRCEKRLHENRANLRRGRVPVDHGSSTG